MGLLDNEDIKDHFSQKRPLPPEPRGGSKKFVQQGRSHFLMHGAYGEYVSTEKGRGRRCRLFSTVL